MSKAAKKPARKKRPKQGATKLPPLAERTLVLSGDGRLIERDIDGGKEVIDGRVTEAAAGERGSKRAGKTLDMIEVVHGIELDEADARALYLPALLPTVRRLIHEAFSGEHQALERLRALHALLFPEVSPSVARALEVRRLMGELSHAVLPSKGGSSLLSGSVKLNEEARGSSAYKLAERYWNPRSTLQSLAIAAYLGKLSEEDKFVGISEDTIRHDLQALHTDDARLGQAAERLVIALSDGETLPFRLSSESWKQRKRVKESS